MKTTHKIAAARAIYRVVRAGRSVLGRGDREIVVRGGITYELDLFQGIDFAIYLANVYERQTRLALRRLVTPSSLVLDIGPISARTPSRWPSPSAPMAGSLLSSRPTLRSASFAATSSSTRRSKPASRRAIAF